jgi:hypothetical protein
MKKLIMIMLVLALLFTFVAQGFAFNVKPIVNSGGEAAFGQVHTEELMKFGLEILIDIFMFAFKVNQGQAIKMIKGLIF